MLRYTILLGFIAFFSLYAFKDWFKSLCALIFMMALVVRPDMPGQMFGIPGLNPWNFLFAFVALGYFLQKRNETTRLEFPGSVVFAFFLMLLMVAIGHVRMAGDLQGIIDLAIALETKPAGIESLFIDNIINTVKWTLPGFLVAAGANSKQRINLLYLVMLVTLALLALQIFKSMPITLLADGTALQKRAARIFDRDIGYHRNQISMLMAAGFWMSVVLLLREGKGNWRTVYIGLMGMFLLALVLSGSRSGFLAWVAVGAVLAWIRWRSLLIIGPLVALVAVSSIPALEERIFEGQSEEEIALYEQADIELEGEYREFVASSSGRTIVWLYVFDKIERQPWFGYGRKAMIRLGITQRIYEMYRHPSMVFMHPHNGYLQLVLDNGILGAVVVLWFFYRIFRKAMKLAKSEEQDEKVMGGITLAFLASYLAASLTAQSFYPNEGVVLVWVCIGLILGVECQRPVKSKLDKYYLRTGETAS